MSFYLVSGDNGIIIHQYYNKAYACRNCFRRNKIKKYDTFEEAEEAALDHLSDILPYYIPVPEQVRLDEMLTIHKLAKEFDEKRGHYTQ